MAKKGRGFVEGHDESVGKGQFANMPQDVMMKEYPRAAEYREPGLDDTMTGIDDVEWQGAEKRRSYMSYQK